jgi:hypothetical protein
MEQWVDKGQPKAIDLLREYTRQLLEELRAPEDHDDLIQKGESFIQKFGPIGK